MAGSRRPASPAGRSSKPPRDGRGHELEILIAGRLGMCSLPRRLQTNSICVVQSTPPADRQKYNLTVRHFERDACNQISSTMQTFLIQLEQSEKSAWSTIFGCGRQAEKDSKKMDKCGLHIQSLTRTGFPV